VWRNRIVGHGLVDGATLVANPLNWRIHPNIQREALTGVLAEVGWVQQVIVNKRSGCVLDGHLRVELSMGSNQKVPVVYVDLDEAEEKKILASLDPLSTMALTDSEALTTLLSGMETENKTLEALLHAMVDETELTQLVDADEAKKRIRLGDPKYQIKAVLYAKQVAIFETALKATGELNRGEALMTICRFYVEEKGQFNIQAEAGAPEASPPGA
jgi:hypothetical protein